MFITQFNTVFRRSISVAAGVVNIGLCTAASYAGPQTLGLRSPAVTEKHIAFVYGGDIWIAKRDATSPRRLTSHPAEETSPKFSPDGKWVAFPGAYDENPDVYIVPTEGGQPKRLTWHPGTDLVNDWHPVENAILFTSRREIRNSRSNQLYKVSVDAGYPQKIMDAVAYRGAYSPSGKRIAYQPYRPAYFGAAGWRQYRGGASPPIWIIDPLSQDVEKIPHVRATDSNPMWLGNSVYFISDRNDGAANLFSYDTQEEVLKQLTRESVWDIKSADGHKDTIVYEKGGRLFTLNVLSGKSEVLNVAVHADTPQMRPQWKDASKTIQNISLSPTGKRVALTARGEVFTVPTSDGSTRNLTKTGSIREMTGIWSTKGDKIAYLREHKGGHRLVIAEQQGKILKTYDFDNTHYYHLLSWGVEDKRIIYSDNHLNLFSVTLENGNKQHIAQNKLRNGFEVALSPDGQWMVYTIAEENYYTSLRLYNFKTHKSLRISDRLVDAAAPVFSPDSKYLYFTVSTNAGPQQFGFDMSGMERPVRSGIYAMVLAADGQSPVIAKQGDEEPKTEDTSGDDEKKDTKKEKKPLTRIDLKGIMDRISALPIPERNYGNLTVAKDGTLLYLEYQQPGISAEKPGSERNAIHSLYRFDFEKKEASLVQSNVADYILSYDGETMLLQGPKRQLQFAKVSKELELKTINLSDVKVFVNPQEEWEQIFNEVWRMEKEYFYAPNLHGIDWDKIYKKYHPRVSHIITREDLNALLVEMIAELQVGHNRLYGGDVHQENPVSIGLLGADVRVDQNRYQIAKIYTGDRWNPFLKAPLAQPGLNVATGEYILAVNGQEVTAETNIFSYFAGTVAKQVTLRVHRKPTVEGSREIVVEPIGSEEALREWDWIENNRKYVAKKTNDQVGYIYIPDTSRRGYAYFNRLFFSQVDKKAMIIDERKNNGGKAANYITDVLSRAHLAGWRDRDSIVFNTPLSAVYGPKVMLIDQDAGSGGDFLPYSFRHMGIGPLIGTRTWGGLIGISANPPLIDGGVVTVPFFRTFSEEGEWFIENAGVVPDVEVELEPDDVNQGIDTQLERGIQEVMQQLKAYSPKVPDRSPPFPTELGK